LPNSQQLTIQELLLEETIWREIGQWRRSANQYASAVALWGRAAKAVRCLPWPPSSAALHAFGFYFCSGVSLGVYCSHIRAALRLVSCDEGVLADTSAVVKGSTKLASLTLQRFKARASAEQTRALARVVRFSMERPDIADSWIVARHFCLRYGAEVVPLRGHGPHSMVTEANVEERKQISLTFYHRKCQNQPVEVTRRCICSMQGRQLCGVCVVHRRMEQHGSGRLFPEVSYTEALAFLKSAAEELGLENAHSWGTHAFRRGWADEALKAGGPTALFYSGGWRGVAAFGYTSAQSKGAIAAAEWLVDFSDSSDDE